MRKQNAKPKLKLARPPKPETANTVECFIPEGVPDDGRLQCVTLPDSLNLFGLRAGDCAVAWEDAPTTNYDFVCLHTTSGKHIVGRYHSAPGGYVRLEDDTGAETYPPSEVKAVCRVMHVERGGEIVRKFPLKKGGPS